jgi:hypothetical protein
MDENALYLNPYYDRGHSLDWYIFYTLGGNVTIALNQQVLKLKSTRSEG